MKREIWCNKCRVYHEMNDDGPFHGFYSKKAHEMLGHASIRTHGDTTAIVTALYLCMASSEAYEFDDKEYIGVVGRYVGHSLWPESASNLTRLA